MDGSNPDTVEPVSSMVARGIPRTQVLIGAIATTIYVLGIAGAAPAVASDAVTVRSASITSEFPTGFRIRLAASSDRGIESIAIRLRIGRLAWTGYDYLEITQRGGSIDGELLWRTNTAAGYIPPGTVIAHSFEIIDEAGQRFETERAQFTYHDPRFEWKEISRGPVTVSYHGRSEAQARNILDATIATLDRMAPLLGADREEPIRVTVYNSWSEMRKAIPPSSAAFDQHLITEGQAFTKVGTLLVLGGRNAIGTASHETTHVLVHRAGEGVLRKVPPWLHEGLAEYGDVDSGRSYEDALQRGIRQDRLLPITHMGSLPGRVDDVLLFYGQAKAMVRMMIEDFGNDKMREFMALYKSGESMDGALTANYGLDRIGLENRWRASVGASPLSSSFSDGKRPTPVPAPTILPYTLQAGAKGQFVGSSDPTGPEIDPKSADTGAASDGEPHDPPASPVYPPSTPGAPGVEGGRCGAAAGDGVFDLTVMAAIIGFVALHVGGRPRLRTGPATTRTQCAVSRNTTCFDTP